MEKKEVRIPIVGVIEEDESWSGRPRNLLEHYPQGEGLYLVKVGERYQELRKVSEGYKDKDGNMRCIIGSLGIPSGIVAEEIKREHEGTIKEYIDDMCKNVLSGILDIREDIKKVHDHSSDLCQVIEDAVGLGVTISETKARGEVPGSGAALFNGIVLNDDTKPSFVPLQGGVSETALLRALEIVSGASKQERKDL